MTTTTGRCKLCGWTIEIEGDSGSPGFMQSANEAALHIFARHPSQSSASIIEDNLIEILHDHDHAARCCPEHGTHSNPHRGCIMR